MKRWTAAELFESYVDMGPSRSYRRIAREARMSLGSVAALAKEGRWRERVEEIERRQRAGRERDLVQLLRERQLAVWEAHSELLTKKAELAQRYRIRTAGDALDLLELAARLQRCFLIGRCDLAERLIDLLLMRMERRGDIDRATLAAALGDGGGHR